MTHYMKLKSRPFGLISQGLKTIELRLNDDKRQKLKIGDNIVFSNVDNESDSINVKVIALHGFPSFSELYKELCLGKCGYLSDEIPSASPKDMEEYYSVEEQKQYGVLGIEIELIKK